MHFTNIFSIMAVCAAAVTTASPLSRRALPSWSDMNQASYTQATLDAHNKYRTKVLPVKFDQSLAKGAFDWLTAINCGTISHAPGAGNSFGETIDWHAQIDGSTNPDYSQAVSMAVDDYMAEKAYYDSITPAVRATSDAWFKYGHYAQVVWKSNTAVGCASARCTPYPGIPNAYWYLTICRYTVPGDKFKIADNVIS